jgi:hypothetical protein
MNTWINTHHLRKLHLLGRHHNDDVCHKGTYQNNSKPNFHLGPRLLHNQSIVDMTR